MFDVLQSTLKSYYTKIFQALANPSLGLGELSWLGLGCTSG